jgi:signal peptidase I
MKKYAGHGLNIFKYVLFGNTKNYKTKDYFLIPLYAILVAVFFRCIFFDHFHVPSGSMLNTLQIGDKIVISKMSYGYSKYAFPFGFAPIKGRIFASEKPQAGDIIVFKLPTDKRTNYVKRLIGLPGDVISISHGILTINGKNAVREKIAENDDYVTYLETLPSGVRYEVIEYFDDNTSDNIPQFTIPEDNYFFMGDNRDNSLDSRFAEVGFVHDELILGKVKRVLISSSNSLLNIFAWHKIRFDRIWKNPYKQ